MAVILSSNWQDYAYNAFRSLCAILCEGIYPLIGFAYKLFMELATFRLIGSDKMTEIYGRITMIITIVMVFYVSFEFVKYAVNPDTMTDKEKGIAKLPQRIIAVIVLIAFIPNIFNYLFKIQNAIIRNDTITKIILGKSYSKTNSTNGNTVDDYTLVGNEFSWNILSNFYYAPTNDAGCEGLPCQDLINLNHTTLIREGKIRYMSYGINSTYNTTDPNGNDIKGHYIEFDPLWAVVVGGVVAFMLILYCVDVGSRTIQMLYLEVTAPVAIMGILSPKKDNIFQKWLKQLGTTYLDVFIRLVLIDFIILISNALLNITNESIGNTQTNDKFVIIALILGMLVFAKKVPKLLGELFPKGGAASGNFGLKPGDRYLPNLGRVAGAALGAGVGAVAGLATGIAQGARKARSVDPNGKHAGLKKLAAGTSGALGGAIRGSLGGVGRGAWNGAKGGKGITDFGKNITAGARSQAKSNKLYGNRAENGYRKLDQMGDSARNALGLPSRVEKIENEKAPIKRHQEALSSLTKSNDAIREHAFKKAKDNGLASYAKYAAAEGRLKRLQEDKDFIASFRDADGKTGESSVAYQKALSVAGKEMKKYKDAAINEYVDSKRTRDGSYSDGKLANLFAERDEQLKDYNRFASASNKIGGDAANNTGKATVILKRPDPSDPTKEIEVAVTKYINEMTAEEYDEYIKQVAMKKEGELGRQLIDMTAEQESIKRATAGSGIGENKNK